MADGFYFADFREAFNFCADVLLTQSGDGIDLRHVEFRKLVADLTRRTEFEQELLVLSDVRRNLSYHSQNSLCLRWDGSQCLVKAAMTRSMSWRLLISVAQSRTQWQVPGRSGLRASRR